MPTLSSPQPTGLSTWLCRRNGIGLILLPISLVRPGLLASLRGYSLETLMKHTDRRVILVSANGTMCPANFGEDLSETYPENTREGGLAA